MLIIGARYSVDQSSSEALFTSLLSSNVCSHPLTSHPACSNSAITAFPIDSLMFSCSNKVSTAPQIPGLRIFEFKQTLIAMS